MHAGVIRDRYRDLYSPPSTRRQLPIIKLILFSRKSFLSPPEGVLEA